MKYKDRCGYCGKDYMPKRRGVQQFCSNSCRSRNWQIKQKKQELSIVNNSQKTEISKPFLGNKISAVGIGNAAIGAAAVHLTKHLLTPEQKKNATKEDVKKLSTLIKGQRYFPVRNVPLDEFGRKPYYDIETEDIVFII